MNAPSPQKTSGLAITSLILGIFSFICCGIFSGLFAIICGHIAQGKIRRSQGQLGGSGLAIAGFILGYLSLFTTIIHLAVAIPAFVNAKDQAQRVVELNNAQQIRMAVTQMSLESLDGAPLGLPADAGIRSVSELKSLLVENGYLPPQAAEALGFENFLFGNISESDPPSTIFIRSLPDDSPEDDLILLKSGEATSIFGAEQIEGTDPPRSPAWLTP